MKMLTIAGGILLLAGASTIASAKPTGVTSVRPSSATGMANNPHWPTFGPVGADRSPDKRDRHRGRHGRGRHGYWPVFGYWGGDGYADSEVTPDMFGYFGAGGDVELIDGEAVYEYDRSYPYDWYSEGPRHTRVDTRSARAGGYQCHTSWVPDASGKKDSPVRVCRR